MPDPTNPPAFTHGQSWSIELRGPVEDVSAQLKGLVRVPAAYKQALATEIDALWPAAGGTLLAVKIFCRVSKIPKRDKTEKRELHLNGSITEI